MIFTCFSLFATLGCFCLFATLAVGATSSGVPVDFSFPTIPKLIMEHTYKCTNAQLSQTETAYKRIFMESLPVVLANRSPEPSITFTIPFAGLPMPQRSVLDTLITQHLNFQLSMYSIHPETVRGVTQPPARDHPLSALLRSALDGVSMLGSQSEYLESLTSTVPINQQPSIVPLLFRNARCNDLITKYLTTVGTHLAATRTELLFILKSIDGVHGAVLKAECRYLGAHFMRKRQLTVQKFATPSATNHHPLLNTATSTVKRTVDTVCGGEEELLGRMKGLLWTYYPHFLSIQDWLASGCKRELIKKRQRQALKVLKCDSLAELITEYQQTKDPLSMGCVSEVILKKYEHMIRATIANTDTAALFDRVFGEREISVLPDSVTLTFMPNNNAVLLANHPSFLLPSFLLAPIETHFARHTPIALLIKIRRILVQVECHMAKMYLSVVEAFEGARTLLRSSEGVKNATSFSNKDAIAFQESIGNISHLYYRPTGIIGRHLLSSILSFANSELALLRKSAESSFSGVNNTFQSPKERLSDEQFFEWTIMRAIFYHSFENGTITECGRLHRRHIVRTFRLYKQWAVEGKSIDRIQSRVSVYT